MSFRNATSSIQNSEFRIQKGVSATIIALTLCVAVGRVDAQTVEPLFADAAPGLTTPATADPRPFVVRSRTAVLQTPALDRALASPATNSFTLNLFDDAAFAVTFERSEVNGLGHRSWAGHITGRPMTSVTLTLSNDFVIGMVTDGVFTYEIRGLGNGVHRIDQMDTSLMLPEVDIAVPGPSSDADATPVPPAVASPSATSTVDIFVYYSPGLRAFLGGSTQAATQASNYVAAANQAYMRSGIDGALNLVGTAELASVPEGADSEELLDYISAAPDVINQRNASNADLVALLVRSMAAPGPNSISCGVAWVGVNGASSSSNAFSVTASRSECEHTFVHEVGHNLGGQHAPDDSLLAPTGSAQYPAYARGYKFQGAIPFRTVMAYDCKTGPACPRILNFSNPSKFENGQATGTASQRNASRLAELFPQVAAYRAGGPPPPPLSAPQNLQAFTNGFNVTLQWQAPASGTPTSFVVGAGTGPGLNNIGVVPVGLTLSASGSLPAGVYFVRVYALDAAGPSPASNEVSFSLGTTAPPGPPSNLVFNLSGNTLSLAWQPPSTGGAPTGYLIDAGTASGLSNIVAGLPVAGTSLVAPGIPVGRYFIRIRARNGLGASAPSNEVDVIVGPACTLPSAPQAFAVTKLGSNLAASWSAPAVGVPAAYILQVGSSPGAANLFNGSVGLTTSLSGAVPNGAYFLRVMAGNACGIGPATGEIAIAVP